MRLKALILLAAAALAPAFAQTYRGLLGAEAEIGEADRSRAFVDIARTFRPSDSMPVDQDGWPTADFDLVVFDSRNYAAWNSAIGIDDPEDYVPDWSGVYHLSFKGQASVTSTGDPATVTNLVYDPATNTTTADLTLSKATRFLQLGFSNTQRTATTATSTGVTGVRIIRPGYAADTTQVFTNEFLDSIKPYSYLRFMGVLDTNGADPAFDQSKTIAQNQKQWSDRRLPTDATQQSFGKKHGLAWEYVIELANASGKDIWINIPVSASEDYVTQLAQLMYDTLKPGIRIYIEHGNEVWNGSFTTYHWNMAAMRLEWADPNTKLDKNPVPDGLGWVSETDELGQRRHARRVAEIGKIFLSVYGNDAFGKIIRPVYAGWTILPDQYRRVLAWIKNNVGDPAALFYGIAQTHYYNDSAVRKAGTTVQQVLDAFRKDSDGGISLTDQLHQVASDYGLKLVIYEAGADIGRTGDPAVSGDTPSANVPALAFSITACRDPQMKDIVLHDARDNWFAHGGSEYTYFTMNGRLSRWGCWGAVEDVVGPKADSPKFQGIQQLVGGPLSSPVITPNGIVNAATYAAPVTAGGFASIFGQNFAGKDYGWDVAIAGGRLPAVLGAVAVRVNGRDAMVSYAGPLQINFIVPPDTAAGAATVEVIAQGGKAAATVQVGAVAPGLFGDMLDGSFQLKALFANTTTYVARPGGWGAGVSSKPAQKGDYLELYGTGLGLSGAPFGRVLTQPYPIDPSLVRVTVGGKDAPVQWAGVTYAGLFQINIQVPDVDAGLQPVVVTIGGASSKVDAVLLFTN